MNEETKKSINKLSWVFYKMNGYDVPTGTDFSVSNNPQYHQTWNMSVVAHAMLQQHIELLDEQL